MKKRKNNLHQNIHIFAATVFFLVSIGHALRLGFGLPIEIGTYQVPNYLSWLAVFLAGYLSVMLWKTAHK